MLEEESVVVAGVVLVLIAVLNPLEEPVILKYAEEDETSLNELFGAMTRKNVGDFEIFSCW